MSVSLTRTESLTLAPTADPRVFVDARGTRYTPPDDWDCLPPGDAGLTRRVKAAGPTWQVIEKRGRKSFSRGLWAPLANIERARADLAAERSTDAYAKKRAADTARRERGHAEYARTFEAEVHAFLRFAPPWDALAGSLAHLVAAHATPVGSGTVARTERIPIERRAEAAVIAWMRHQTTSYDDMRIERVAGRRREVRRELAQLSRAVLELHRRPAPHAPGSCSLCTAVADATKNAGVVAVASATTVMGHGATKNAGVVAVASATRSDASPQAGADLDAAAAPQLRAIDAFDRFDPLEDLDPLDPLDDDSDPPTATNEPIAGDDSYLDSLDL